jgi:glycosyltransferase involved in cell wall biosynthesis/CDP-glycerol glycerophosphotransferase (TagB/SpsB family)
MTKKGLYKLIKTPHLFIRDYLKKKLKLEKIIYIDRVRYKENREIELQKIKKREFKEKPLVSIVIPFYNVELYLAETLNSIIRQSYGIENLEVILVDDCGDDSSLNIAEKYIPFLGSRVQLIRHKENRGLGGARNSGIELASGKYIMFIDSDDFIDKESITELVWTIESDKSDIVIYNMRIFSELNKSYPLNPSFELFKIFKENSLKINRYEFPRYISLAHSFSACNKLFKRELFLRKMRFPENQHHEDALLIMNLLANSQNGISLVKNVYYNYRQRESLGGNSITDELFHTREHYFEHLEIVEGLKELSNKYFELEYMFLWVSIRIMGRAIIEFLLDETPLNINESKEFFDRTKTLFIDRDYLNTYEIGSKTSLKSIKGVSAIVNSNSLKEAQKFFKQNNIEPSKKVFFINFFNKDNIQPLFNKKITRREDIILIGERPFQARDNGYWLFRYIRENYPNINIYYVITKESADFYKIEKLNNFVIYDSNLHYELFFNAKMLISTHTRGTIEPSRFNKFDVKKQYRDYYKKRYIFIQHGINVGGFINAFDKSNSINANFSKIVTGALPEYRYLASNLSYKNDVVVYTGLARFDNIINSRNRWGVKNRILFMPTWRANICSPTYKKEKIYNDSKFLSSNYYSEILSFLNDNRLDKTLQSSNLELHFIPHPEVEQYIDYFTSFSKNIKIRKLDSLNIQEELIEAKLLITDYSSVFFDFAFMKKPIIFYQFDKEEFFSKHYQKGYFDFEKHNFGEICSSKKELVSKIRKSINEGFAISKDIELTHLEFFLKYDNKNCYRIYKEIEKLL